MTESIRNNSENRINLAAICSGLFESTPFWRLVLVLLLTSLGTTRCAPMTWSDESRMATIQYEIQTLLGPKGFLFYNHGSAYFRTLAFVANIRQFVEHMRHPRYLRQNSQAQKP